MKKITRCQIKVLRGLEYFIGPATASMIGEHLRTRVHGNTMRSLFRRGLAGFARPEFNSGYVITKKGRAYLGRLKKDK